MSLTSDEVNFLVYRYLLEAGKWGCDVGAGAHSTVMCFMGTESRDQRATGGGRGEQYPLFPAPAFGQAGVALLPASSTLFWPLPASSGSQPLTSVDPPSPVPSLPPSLPAGFTHTAFVFGCESQVNKAHLKGKDVPVGALVSFIQKGFQYMEIEANLNEVRPARLQRGRGRCL